MKGNMVKGILLTIVIVLSAAIAFANDYIEYRTYSDKNFGQNRVKAVGILKDRGYRVYDIDADDFRGQLVLEVEAFRDGQEYDITLSYSDPRIIRERVDH